MLVKSNTAKTSCPPGQKLPPQYEAQFKQVIKFYEARSFSKAIKSADVILKAHPDHGETLSIKGLLLSSLNSEKVVVGEKSPQEYAKLGLARNIGSYLCWQVFGLIHRTDRNYREASKCYRQAVRLDPENVQILRDLATLQTQIRDIPSLLETRNALLSLKPNVKANWIGLAIAHYLSNNYEVAFHILEAFEKATAATESKIEISELQLFKIQTLMKCEDYAGALSCLHAVSKKVLDRLALLTAQAQCEAKIGQKDSAAATYIQLLKENPHNSDALLGYVQVKVNFPVTSLRDISHTPAQRREILNVLVDLNMTLGGSSKNVQRECLDVCDPDELRSRLATFAKPYIVKNIPSLYSAIKSLYLRKEFWAVIESLFLEWKVQLEKHNAFAGEELTHHNPTALVWVLTFLALHYLRLGKHEEALLHITQAIEHSPTLEHLYVIKAKIYKHQGHSTLAADTMNFAREMDLADRYLTNRAVKYMLRDNRIEDAAVMYATFSRAKEGEVLNNIVDLQCMWYELELADSYYRQGDLISALERYLLVEKHFTDFYEDQIDFHGYCIRKYTLRAYMDLIEFHDQYQGHPLYMRAAGRIADCYLRIEEEGVDYLQTKRLPLSKTTGELPKGDHILTPKLDSSDVLIEEAFKFSTTLERYKNRYANKKTALVELNLLLSKVYVKKQLYVLAMRFALDALNTLEKKTEENDDVKSLQTSLKKTIRHIICESKNSSDQSIVAVSSYFESVPIVKSFLNQ